MSITIDYKPTNYKPLILEVLRTGPVDGFNLFKIIEELDREPVTLGALYRDLAGLCCDKIVEQQKVKPARCLYRLAPLDPSPARGDPSPARRDPSPALPFQGREKRSL